MIEGVVIELIDGYRSNEINKDKVVQLNIDISKYQDKVILLESQIEQTKLLIKDKDKVIGAVDEQAVLSKAEIRKLKNKAVGDWFKDKWQQLTIGTGAFGIGIGIGYLLK